MEAPVPTGGDQNMYAGYYIKKTQGSGKSLGKDCRECGALHPHAEADDEKKIEKYIGAGGKNQEEQRGPAVSYRAQKR